MGVTEDSGSADRADCTNEEIVLNPDIQSAAGHDATAAEFGASEINSDNINSAKVNSCTLHEHLHQQLHQLISVAPPEKDSDKNPNNGSPESKYFQSQSNSSKFQQNPQHLLNILTPKELLQNARNDVRREEKVAVLNRLLSALREDQSGSSNKAGNTEKGEEEGTSEVDFIGRIHGCVGSHWELLPPLYPNNSSNDDVSNSSKQGKGHDVRMEEEEKDAATVTTLDSSTTLSTHASTTATPMPMPSSPNPKKKSLVKRDSQLSSSLNFQGMPSKVAAMTPDNSPGGAGIPSPWASGRRRSSWNQREEAVNALRPPPLVTSEETSKKEGYTKPDPPSSESSSTPSIQPLIRGGGLHLPGLDWNKTFRKGYSVLVWVRPTLDDAVDSVGGASSTRIPRGTPPRKQVLYRFATNLNDNVLGSVGVCAILGQWTAVPFSCNGEDDGRNDKEKKKLRKRTMLTTSVTAYTLPNADPMSHLYPASKDGTSGDDARDTASTINKSQDGGKPSSNPPAANSIEFKGGNAHARNLEHFQKYHAKQNAAVTNQGRLVNKAKKTGKQVLTGDGSKGDSSRHKDANEANASPSSMGGYVTAQLTLPADEWSLIGIQHTHPYLRRPELIISVNGEEMVKGELGYPVLDGVINPSDEEGASSPFSPRSPKNAFNDNTGERWGALDDHERKMLKRRGIFAECTLLDGAFDNGVRIFDSKSSSKHGDQSHTPQIATCSASVHSIALLPGPPVPNAVLAMVAERGPLGDSATGGGLSFVLGPVPTNPQNRDAVVALSAGHGYYGSGGVGGSGHGGLVGRSGGAPSDLVPPRSLGIPVSIGITPGVEPSKARRNGDGGGETSSGGSSISGIVGDTWIGGGEEHVAHVGLQGLLGRAVWTFHAGDTTTLGVTSCTSSFSAASDDPVPSALRRRIVCAPSAAPACIGGADAVPKVGIVRPTIPAPTPSGRWSGLEVIGNARYQNVTLNYIQRENNRQSSTKISISSDIYSKYESCPPVSFSRAVQSSNAINCAILPFRLALPRAGNEEVNDVQRAIHAESFSHLNDLLSNGAQLAGSIIRFVAECIRCGGSSMRDEALQNGVVHVLVNLTRKCLIRGERLGVWNTKERVNPPLHLSSNKVISRRNNGKSSASRENFDYDQDHDSSCPPIIPSAISKAMVELIDVCCGPLPTKIEAVRGLQYSFLSDPYRGLLRVRRASDSALTILFGLAMDFDLLGNDPVAAAPILEAIAQRYCQKPTAIIRDQINVFDREDYGYLLRKQMNLQYFLDTIRVRFDHSVIKAPGESGTLRSTGDKSSSTLVEKSIKSIATSLSDILYSMILSTLTSSSGTAVTRGERDVGALVATLTECPLGSVCAHVVTTTIAKLLVKCRVLSPLCLGSQDPVNDGNSTRRSNRALDLEEVALESRLGRNLLLCHYHDIVAPLLLSRIVPHNSLQQTDSRDEKNDGEEAQKESACQIDFINGVTINGASYPLDWTYHWRLSLLIFVWLNSLAGADEGRSASTSVGHLLLASANAGSLDGALLGNMNSGHALSKADILGTLAKFLVLTSSGEKDSGVIAKKAESISSRLSMFMPLVPGISFSLLSSSFFNTEDQKDLTDSLEKLSITDATVLAADTLKEILSMLSLSIQALYGSKKGLITSKPGSKGGVHLNKAKVLFVSAAKEYTPTLLQVVSMLDGPIQQCRHVRAIKRSSQTQHVQLSSLNEDLSKVSIDENHTSDVDPSSDSIQRIRTDSSDKDWVDVSAPKAEPSVGDELLVDDVLSPLSSPVPPEQSKNVGSASNKETSNRSTTTLEQSVYSELGSCQDIALYAVSRLVAQAMKYGGGEASTAVWRVIVSALSDSVDKSSLPPDEKSRVKPATKDPDKTFFQSTLCHLAALVLSKFARHHDQRLATYRSSWNLETCSAVARLMDLVEEKQLLSNPQQKNQQKASKESADSSKGKDDKSSASPGKYSIDQVRLLKSLLEIMASGRESAGWSQSIPSQSPNGNSNDNKQTNGSQDEIKKTDVIGKSTNNSNYDLYHQGSSSSKSTSPTNSKLLLPILQSCLRIVLPSMGVIRSEAVVISAAAPGKAPSTAVLLELVSTELRQSLTAAISGLSFPVSRDIFMNAVASLRRSLNHHNAAKDSKAVVLCCNLVLALVEAMRLKYTNERNRKEKVSNESVDSQAVESLILGEDLLPKSVSTAALDGNVDSNKNKSQEQHYSSDADFIAFPGDGENDGDPAKMNASSMGWSQYRGLGAALARCYRELNDRPSLGTRCLGLSGSLTTPADKAESALSILECYIDNWDKMQAQDADEAELVDLFDESIHLDNVSREVSTQNSTSVLNSTQNTGLHFPSLLASDAMTRFTEAQSMLKHQHRFLAFDYLVSRRFGRSAFAERLCWKTWMDCVGVDTCNALWERGAHDGGRDFCSKIATLPMFPQFPRFIPSYLDHSPSSISDAVPSQGIEQFNSLVSSSIKIVDITKKEIAEELLAQVESTDEGTEDNVFPEVLHEDEEEEELEVHFPSRMRGGVHDSLTDSDRNFESAENSERVLEVQKYSSDTHGREDVKNEEGANKAALNIEEAPTNYLTPRQGSFHFATSSFSFPPDSNSLNSLGEGVRLAGGSMEEYYSSCLHVKAEFSKKCTVMVTDGHLILEYEDGEGVTEGENESHHQKKRSALSGDELQNHDQAKLMEDALRPKAMRWNISETSHIYLRRYRLRDSAMELFFIPSAGATTGGSALFVGSRSLFIDFGAGTWGNTRRDDAANAIMKRAPMQTVKQWPDKSGQFLHEELKKLTHAWTQGAISNFDYLLSLNCLSGRSYNDICQYPVMPWVLSNYSSEEAPDLTDKANFRDLSKPIGALNNERLAELIDRFETFADPCIPAFMYGSHYSTSAGVVIHFLLRLHPFSSLHRHLQSGHFDVADRLFSSVQRTWEMCTGRSAAEVKELTPEFYSNPAFLRNTNELKLGTSQDGEVIGDVILPPWAKGSPEKFVEVMRLALESDVCSKMLPDWIDLIFGRKQQGKLAIDAHNVFFYLTYYGSVDVASIEDEGLREATELQIAHFGQCPMQLFYRRHASKKGRGSRRRRQTLSEYLRLYDAKLGPWSNHQSTTELILEKSEVPAPKQLLLPFMDAPLSYWVHLGAPPPGPHAPLISIRLALADRCMAIDSRGIFHFFRWAWKPELGDDELSDDGIDSLDDASSSEMIDLFNDKGCFVAQRELFNFRNIPRLPYAPMASESPRHVTVCVSKTLFANRSLLLVLSDGDGKGGLAMQLIDPVKGAIRGEVIVPSAHADYITSINMDPIGTAAGQGGVGGELAMVGSADGSCTLWRFISSHYWPLRPRLRMSGHSGSKVNAVAVGSSLGICASVSADRCCLFDVGNGSMIRNFLPPVGAGKGYLESNLKVEGDVIRITFAETPAMCLSILGFVVVVCCAKLQRGADTVKEVFSLELLTLEGMHVGSRLLEPHRRMPRNIFPTVDGRAVFVCAGGGMSVHLISCLQPLDTVDEWRLSDDEEKDDLARHAMYDLDFGPTTSRPVVAAAGCSEGALRLHALQGISKWSKENQRNTMSSTVGSVLALPAQTVKNALGGVAGIGSRFVGLGKEIGKEAFSVVKEREGGFFFRKNKDK